MKGYVKSICLGCGSECQVPGRHKHNPLCAACERVTEPPLSDDCNLDGFVVRPDQGIPKANRETRWFDAPGD